MKFSVSNPPASDAGLESVVAWLWELHENLEAVLENIGSENLGSELRRSLEAKGRD